MDWRSLLSNEAIIQMVGHEAFARGVVYARNGKVSDVEVDGEEMIVRGRVLGGYRDGYDTTVQLQATANGWTAHQGRCSCPVALDCKHAAALLIVARSAVAAPGPQDQPAWEVALGRLVRAPEPAPVEPMVVGLDFDVERFPPVRGRSGRTSLRMRPVHLGSAGTWLRSGASWDELDYAGGQFRRDHRDLLVQLRSAAGANARFRLPRSPWLPLTDVAASFWSLLAEACRVGLPLVTNGGTPDQLVSTRPATVVLDARRQLDGSLELTPRPLLDGEPLEGSGWGLLGDPAHGIYLFDGPLNLVRLTEPLSRELRRLLDADVAVQVPVADEGRFLTDYLPALRRRTRLLSTDHSFEVPEPPMPELALSLAFRPQRRVRLDWTVRYRSGDTDVCTFPLDEPARPGTVRDFVAEREALAGLPLPYERLPQLGTPGRPTPHALLGDVDAAIFVEQVLPELRAAGVDVAETGDRVDYRRSDTPPQIELAAVEVEGTDWFDLHIRVRVDQETVPFEDLFTALAQGEEFLVLDTGVYVPLRRPELDTLRGLIDEARQLSPDERPGVRLNGAQLGLWEELVSLGVVVGQCDRWSRSVAALAGATTSTPPVPAELRAELRPYQVEGFGWLTRLWSAGLGGILADDMGLGKTVQALALVCHIRAREPDGPPMLVVAPTSVVSNWTAEARRFAPQLRVVEVANSQARRRQPLAEAVAGADLVVTSYALLRIDADGYAAASWSGMILDEAQFVKNARARTYAAARAISAPVKIAITGTPLENNLMELWSLFSITSPGLFPHPDRFAEYYRRPIERDHDTARLAQLRRRIRPLMLRRTKEMVAAELPPKQEQVVDVVLQPRHARIYQTYLQRERQKVLGLLEDVEGNRFTILRSLTLLRQLSLDPALVEPIHAGVPASKADLLVEMLTEVVGEGHRALVFSQFTGFLGSVARRLDRAGLSFTQLDGSTRHRDAVVERFRGGDAPVFLISLKAGGFGLNLTEADYCFVLDPWWNPAAEAQAVDRAHRIGQEKTVLVYRLVAANTIEEKVMELKARKEQLFHAVLSEDAWRAAALDEDDIRQLLDLPAGPGDGRAS